MVIPNNTNIFIYGEDEPCYTQNKLVLRKRTKRNIIDSLEELGIDANEAYKMVDNTHGLYVPLKKKLFDGAMYDKPDWIEGHSDVVIAALLCGKWTEATGDVLVFEELSGKAYSDCKKELGKYLHRENPYIVSNNSYRGSNMQLASVEDAWEELDLYINDEMWDKFISLFYEVLIESEPIFEYPFEKHFEASIYAKKPEWSPTLKKGMIRTLIMRAYYRGHEENQKQIDNIVAKVLDTITSKERWGYISQYLPELCEASPESVLRKLESEIEVSQGLIDLFAEKDGDFMTSRHYYTNVLWAVEQLIQQKKYVARALEWLWEIDSHNIKFSINNSPKGVLDVVFCAWINESALTVEQKIELARSAIERYPNAWDVIASKLPHGTSSICSTLNTPKYRRIDEPEGAHIWIFFDKPISAAVVRKFGLALLDKGAEQVNLKSFNYYDRMLPAQDSLENVAIGNLIALPLQGRALKDGNSAFVDGNWNAYPDQWNALLSKPKLSEEFLENKIREWTFTADDLEASSDEENREKPWDRMKNFAKSDVDGKMDITLSNGIYVDSTNLKPAMQNKIRRMAAFSNPVFYKNRAIGTSNYDTSRWIYLGKDHLGGYIQIPRGLQDELIANIDKAGIEYTIDDERQQGRNINVEFNGELRPEQNKALKELTKHDNGILHAATAFGKTVVCSAVIAEKKVNTLILLESSALIEQWKDALNKFLIIDEELPQYKTKTGRLRTRKSLIGTLQGVHDSMTGIVDIAMVGSLCKKGEFHNLLNDYGLVIIDECHHSASETIANVLKEVKARYVYGVTATPKRGDGLEKINYMLIGPIRYSYTAKEKAMEQGIQHLVYPRFTRTVPPRGVLIGKMHPNEAYEIIHNNDIRDEQIVEDVKNCVSAGRTPVVLSRYKDHSEKLYERLKDYADHVFLMTGNNSKKEHKKILEQMHQVYKAESLILIATGSLVGEGFDFPRLDTLFMATPVSFRGVVEQYAGRLNRDYAGKENVIIYDYVDNHITMFNNMYMKRLKAYKQIGYEIAGGLHNDKQTANAIYDGDNYAENYHKDLLDANKNIIISSPAISGTKVYELINLLKEKQLSGVQITIVTWAPDSYGFGDASYWMQLHEEMRKAGFYIKTVEESCERFAVIDQEVVWYGNINLLAKDKVDDSIMRVLSKEIASELMEITFGDNG